MNFVKFEFTDGSHMSTSKHSDFPIQKLFFFLDKMVGFHVFNSIKIERKKDGFFVGEKKLKSVIVEKQILHRKEYKCQI